MKPVVEILYFDSCPNCARAQALVERVAEDLRVDPEIHDVRVPDAEAATRLRFLGSPTVRVNGRDVEPGAVTRTDYIFACRLYRGANGLSGVPEERWIRDALELAAAQA